MRTIHNYMEAAKQRREDGEAGFSLIELIIVVVILGILVAVAIPLVGALQKTAKQNSVQSAASDAATQVAAQLAQDATPELPASNDKISYQYATVASGGASTAGETAPSGLTVDDLCVAAISGTGDDALTAFAGPADGCTGNSWDD